MQLDSRMAADPTKLQRKSFSIKETNVLLIMKFMPGLLTLRWILALGWMLIVGIVNAYLNEWSMKPNSGAQILLWGSLSLVGFLSAYLLADKSQEKTHIATEKTCT